MLRNVSIVFGASLIAEVEHLFLRERTRIRTSRDLAKGLHPIKKGILNQIGKISLVLLGI